MPRQKHALCGRLTKLLCVNISGCFTQTKQMQHVSEDEQQGQKLYGSHCFLQHCMGEYFSLSETKNWMVTQSQTAHASLEPDIDL